MTKGSIQQEDIIIVNKYALNIRAPEYIKQILTDIKEEIDTNTIIVGNLNISLILMDTSDKKSIRKHWP